MSITTYLAAVLVALSLKAEDQKAEVALKKNSIQGLEVRNKDLLDSLLRSNKKMKEIAGKQAELQNQHNLMQAEVYRQKKEISDLSKKVLDSKNHLVSRVKALSQIKSGNIIQALILNSRFHKMDRNLRILAKVTSHDLQSLNEFQSERIKIKTDLNQLKARTDSMLQQEAKLEKVKIELSMEIDQRNKKLAELKKSKNKIKSEIQAIRSSSPDTNFDDLGVFDVLTKEPILAAKGRLPHPIEGEIIQPYGVQDHDDQYVEFSTGQYYQIGQANNVKAIFAGVITFLSHIEGLGLTAIVDHGDNYYSIYGGLESTTVKINDIVTAGQLIGKAGHTPLVDKAGLYFEIRNYSIALNPNHWLRKADHVNN